MPGFLPPACWARGKLGVLGSRQEGNGTLRWGPLGESLIKRLFHRGGQRVGKPKGEEAIIRT